MDLLGFDQSSQKGKLLVRGELAFQVVPGVMPAALKAVRLDGMAGPGLPNVDSGRGSP